MSAGPPEAVVSCAVGHRRMGQAQAGGRQQQRWRGGILTAGEDVDDDRAGRNPAQADGLGPLACGHEEAERPALGVCDGM